jgi:hypothetical protein
MKTINLFFNTKSLLILATFLFEIGVFAHFYRNNLFYAKPTEYFMLASSFLIFISLLKKGLFEELEKLKFPFIVSTLIFIFVFTASLIGNYFYDLSFEMNGIRLLLKLILNITIFLGVLYILNNRPSTLRELSLLFWLPFCIYIPIVWIYFINPHILFEVVGPSGRFQGFSEGPGAIAFSLNESIPIIFASFLAVKSKFKKIILLAPFFFLTIIIFWCASRIAFISLLFSLIYIILIFLLLKQKKMTFNSYRVLFFNIIIFLFVAYLTTQHLVDVAPFKHLIIERVTGFDTYDKYYETVTFKDLFIGAYNLITNPEINVRIPSFKYYYDLCIHNIFGVGVNYFPKLAFVRSISYQPTPTDSILDTWVHGGIGLFLTLIFFCFTVFKLYLLKIKKSFELANQESGYLYIGFSAAFIANIIVTIFGGFPIYSLKFWILCAIPFTSYFEAKLLKGKPFLFF